MSSPRSLELTGRQELVKISATDLSNADDCPRRLALKIRPEVKPTDWRRTYGDQNPFPLADVLDVFEHAVRTDVQPADAVLWVRDRVQKSSIRRILRPYVAMAALNALEAHWDLSEEVGGFTHLLRNPTFGPPDRVLTVWGFLHATDDGIREIRRYRIGSAHAPGAPSDTAWTQTAARVAVGVAGGPSVTRVRVVEVGLVDGSIEVHFDGSRDEAIKCFTSGARATAQNLGDLNIAVPGYGCSSCKATGVCDALVDVSGALGQDSPGYQSRSTSASALDRYRVCPTQWLLSTELNLPRDHEVSEAQQRGLWVHQWLEHAHAGGGACSLDDPGPLDAHEFATARPFLAHHVATCPLATDGVEFVASEENLHTYDASADVVCVAKPDLVYRIGDRVVVREFKTAAQLPPDGVRARFADSVQVPLMTTLLDAGLAAAFGGTSATVEVEVLTPEASALHTWDIDDPDVIAEARAQVAAAVAPWHVDDTWDPTPGEHCGWCPVREWCPDAHSGPRVAAADALDPEPDDEPPPF